jgi:hypothetical protein
MMKKLFVCVNPLLAGFAGSQSLESRVGENGFTQKI